MGFFRILGCRQGFESLDGFFEVRLDMDIVEPSSLINAQGLDGISSLGQGLFSFLKSVLGGLPRAALGEAEGLGRGRPHFIADTRKDVNG